jgi:serine/threonine protein kinase
VQDDVQSSLPRQTSAVLLFPNLQVKIGDFGFTKRLKGNKDSLKVKRITHPRWVAPEVRKSMQTVTMRHVHV